ncbi:MAG: hypothetical protein IPM18_16725 [Phycisphaerales bacterium]|nr:hypothetical protein [Phycisphaerales bacterium]
MNLIKILRKNSKTLILVFMSLLLVAFLVPEAIQSGFGGGRGPNPLVGRVGSFNTRIRLADLQAAKSEVELALRIMGQPVQLTIEMTESFYLLREEARRAGIRVGKNEVREMLAAMNVQDEDLMRIQDSTRMPYDRIYEIVGDWLGVVRYQQWQSAGILTSLPREKFAFIQQRQQARARVALLEARAFLDAVPEPTAEELTAFFETARDRATAHTNDELVFGYRLPDRVRVEIVTIDPVAMEQVVEIRAAQVREFFNLNRHRYTKPDPNAVDGAPTARIPMELDEARELVRVDFRRQRAIEESQRAINRLFDEAYRPWITTEVGDDGFRKVPGDVIGLRELVEKYRGELPLTYQLTDLLDRSKLTVGPDQIGLARYSVGQQTVGFAELALRVAGILSRNPDDGLPVFAVQEPGRVVRLAAGDPSTPGQPQRPYQAYLFRIVEVAPSGPATDFEAIRAQVAEDWRMLRAFELARAQAEALAEQAAAIGLTAAIEAAADLKAQLTSAEQVAATQPLERPDGTLRPPARFVEALGPHSPAPFGRQGFPFVAGIGAVQGIVTPAFELGTAAAPDTGHRVRAVPLAVQQRWAVLEVEEILPLYTGEFNQYLASGFIGSEWERMQFTQVIGSPQYTFERLGYVRVQPNGGAEDDAR